MAETNAYFDEAYYHSASIKEIDNSLLVSVTGRFEGLNDPDKPFSGDQIDMTVMIEIERVAGQAFYNEPYITANGHVNDDWVDPELKYGLIE